MVANDKDTAKPKPKAPAQKTLKTTIYPGMNDGRISASKHAGMRAGASRPAPMKK